MKNTLFAVLLLVYSMLSASAFADVPSAIRIGFPGVGTGNRPVLGGSQLSTAHLQGSFEEEFKKDGIKIEWNHFKFAGPAVNEAFANDLLDFAYEGDLPMVTGRAAGLKTKVLAAGAMRTAVSIAVPSDSPVRSVADLRGKKLAVAKGTNIQLATARVLAKFGLAESDVREVNILGTNATDALATKDIDAVIASPTAFYPLRDRGTAKIIYESRNADVVLGTGFLGREAFISKYPEITRRILKVYLKAALYSSDENNRTALFKLWSQDGTSFAYYKEIFGTDSLIEHETPLIDEYWLTRYKAAIADAYKYKLIRKEFDINTWIDTGPLNAALKELGLETRWAPYGADGKAKR